MVVLILNWIECHDCRARGPEKLGADAAREAWNRRAPRRVN
jgi:hypothetical protein